MICKRFIGVVTVRNGWAVQSFGYSRYLPLGRPEVMIENLDRWGVDEIFLNCIDRGGKGPDIDLLGRLSRMGVTTALSYAGGICNSEQAVAAVGAGADRIAVDAAFIDNPALASDISRCLGSQALIASTPVRRVGDRVERFDYRNLSSAPFAEEFWETCAAGNVSEIIITDCQAEGGEQPFDAQLIEALPVVGVPIIAFGGIRSPELASQILEMEQVSAVAVGNFLSYQEHAAQNYKRGLKKFGIREPYYQSFKAGLPFNVTKL